MTTPLWVIGPKKSPNRHCCGINLPITTIHGLPFCQGIMFLPESVCLFVGPSVTKISREPVSIFQFCLPHNSLIIDNAACKWSFPRQEQLDLMFCRFVLQQNHQSPAFQVEDNNAVEKT